MGKRYVPFLTAAIPPSPPRDGVATDPALSQVLVQPPIPIYTSFVSPPNVPIIARVSHPRHESMQLDATISRWRFNDGRRSTVGQRGEEVLVLYGRHRCSLEWKSDSSHVARQPLE